MEQNTGIEMTMNLSGLRGTALLERFRIIDRACEELKIDDLSKIIERLDSNSKIIFVGNGKQIKNKYITKYEKKLQNLLEKNKGNLNQDYWKHKLNERLEQEISDENVLFKNIEDTNPIFTYINREKTKAIRVIQDDATKIETNNFEGSNHMISAWLDEITTYDNSDVEQLPIKELVIALFLTKETVDISMNLIVKWLKEGLDDNEIDVIINKELSI